jgi:hypothetical protein
MDIASVDQEIGARLSMNLLDYAIKVCPDIEVACFWNTLNIIY